jgi:hypothetical protein
MLHGVPNGVNRDTVEGIFESTISKIVAVTTVVVTIMVWQYTQIVIPIKQIDNNLATLTNQLNTHISSTEETHEKFSTQIAAISRNEVRLCDAIKLQCEVLR